MASFGMLYICGTVAILCFILGIIYPAIMALLYPLLKSEDESFSEYIKNI
ncbi:MAG: hypothetical protein AB7D36_05455 [Oscillospiraceae bacterium]